MKKWSTKEPKFWKVMKLCAVQSLLSMILFGVSIAHDGSGQILETKITLDLKDQSLKTILEQIEKGSGIKFIYSEVEIASEERISLRFQDANLQDVLDELLTSRHFKFKVHEKEQIITLKKEQKGTESEASRPQVQRAAPVVTGVVTGGSPAEPLAGVNVLIRGTAIGTTTDADGKYSIEASGNDILVFSFIGFQSFETRVGDRTLIDVVLGEDSKKLNEVVVNAGYWEVESRESTGNITRVTAKDISNQPVSNPVQALQGRMAGVQVVQSSGIPGDGFVVQVRGVNSLRGGAANDPLYIVDGVPFSSSTLSNSISNSIVSRPSPFNSLNPADIESIEVLKDADATAIYGSRGANGVVLITTKKGKIGKTSFDMNVYTGAGTVSKFPNLLNTSQYLRMRKEAFKNDGVAPTASNAPDLLVWDTTRYTNWQKTLLDGVAHTTSAQATLSGGSAHTQFTVGTGYYRQSTVFPSDFNYQKGSAHMSLRHTTINNKLSMVLTSSFVTDQNNLPTTDFTSLSLTLPPDAPAIYDASGNLNWQNGTWSNPYAELRKSYRTSSKNLVSNLNVSYEMLPGLRVKANLGYNYLAFNEKIITPIAAQNPATSPLGSSFTSNGTINTWIAEPQIDYQKAIGEGKLIALFGTTFQQSIRDRQGISASGFTNDSQLENIAAATTLTSSGTEYSQYRYNAVFARLNYNFRERYIVNLTGRRDGSSRFGPNRRFANFGAVGASWIFSKEGFMANLTAISFGKLRASYGVTGSDQIGDYQYLDTYGATSNNYQGGKGLIPSRLVNPDFGWEENKKLEFGLDLGFLHDKLFFSASYYHNRSSNQLVGYTLPAITGFTSVQYNLPATVQNTGVEVVLTSTNIERKNFRWTSALNISFPQTKLIEYPNIEGSSYANTYKVGESLFIQKKYQSLGVDKQSGIYAFQDVDNNNVLNSVTDTQFLHTKAVSYHGGLQNTFTFRGFELQFLLQFVKQTGQSYMATTLNPPGARSNQLTLVMDRWQKPGDIADVQRFTQGGAAFTGYINARIFGDNILTDASFVRLQNLSFSWTMPSAWSAKIRSEKVRLYLQAQNLLTFTSYVGPDPELQSMLVLPPLRVITIGGQLTF